MSADDVVLELNRLIGVAQDGRKGFAEAAEYAADAELKSLFLLCSAECAGAVQELQVAVQTLGREPAGQGSIAGAAHRGWVALKTRLEDSNVAVLEEVERGEDRAKAAYTKALQADLPTEVLNLVKQQQVGALRNHDRVRDVRNEFRARKA